MKRILTIITFFIMFLFQTLSSFAEPAKVMSLNYDDTSSLVYINIMTSSEETAKELKFSKLENPNRIYFDIDNSVLIGGKQQLVFDNIIVKYVEPEYFDNGTPDYKVDGTGTGYFISNGLAAPITWKKDKEGKDTNVVGYFANEVGTVGDTFWSSFAQYNGNFPGYPGYFVVEGNVMFGAKVVRPEAIIKLVESLPVVSAGSFDAGTKGSSYTHTTAFSGTGVEKFEAAGLPAGLTLNPSSGAITGTPTEEGNYPVSVYGIDKYGNYSNAYNGNIVIS